MLDASPDARIGRKITILAAMLLVTGLSHYATPTWGHYLHSVHLVLGKFFILPIVLAAVWFEIRGAVLVAGAATVLLVPHVLLQWQGYPAERIDLMGEVVTLWVVAVLSGLLVQKRMVAVREAAAIHKGALDALVSALDEREHATGLHSQRVRAYAIRIGHKLGLSFEDLRVLGEGALLHDVGKIGTPDLILLKPGTLTDEERRIMQQHPETGQRVLAGMPFLKGAADVVRFHHERYDGTGYPRHLREEEIPMLARVFSVADVFDALTSNRPYHKKMDDPAAREEMHRESGKAFDPRVVEAFLGIPSQEWDKVRQAFPEC